MIPIFENEYSLNQLPRILNACIDIAAEDEGRVDLVLALMDIAKLIAQVVSTYSLRKLC